MIEIENIIDIWIDYRVERSIMSDDERDEKELDLSYPEVVTKYKSAADIVNSNFSFFFSSCF